MNDQRGQTTVLALGLALLTFALAGLAVDGTRAFLLRRTLQNAADSAGLAGTGAIDTGAYYASGGTNLKLDPVAARSAALSLLRSRGIEASAAVQVDDERVMVSLRADSPTTFLRLVGISSVPVGVEAASIPVPGAPTPTP